MRNSNRARPSSRPPLVVLVGALALPLLGGVAAAQSPAAGERAITYQIHFERYGGRETWWGVTGSKMGELRTATGKTQVVDGSAVGGPPATAVRLAGRPVYLADAWRGGKDLGPGYSTWSPIADSGRAILDSLTFHLADAGAGPEVQGHSTRRARIEVTSWWRSRDASGTVRPFRAAGRADLWFAPDLPFSWLPLAATPRESPEAVPLADWMPGVAGHVAFALGPRLRKLGLLLRAEVHDTMVVAAGPDPAGPYGDAGLARTVTVDSIESSASAPSPKGYAGLPRLSERRSELVQQALFGSSEACVKSLDGAGGVFGLTTSGARSITGSGSAVALPAPGPGAGGLLVMGRLGPVTECLVVVLPNGEADTGSLPVRAVPPSAAPGSSDPPAASAVYLVLDPVHATLHRAAVIESGRLDLEAAGDGAVRGKLSGKGWSLELRPTDRPGVVDGLDFQVSFRAVPAAPGALPPSG